MGRGKKVLRLLDQGCFGGEGGGDYDEGFGGFGRETGEEMLLYGGGAIVHALESGGLPEAGEGAFGCFGHGRKSAGRFRVTRIGAEYT